MVLDIRGLGEAEEKSHSGQLAFIKQLAQNVLLVLEYPAYSPERLETSEDDSKETQNLHIADPDTRQLGLNPDLMEGITVPANTDGGICETPEIIQESDSASIGSYNPWRLPCKNDYKPIKLISSGSFGAVHLVRHKDSNQVCAMKKIDIQNLKEPRRLERAFLERDISIFADCPFVASMFCSFPTKIHLCMVMEYLPGGGCDNLLKDIGHFPVPLARMYIAETIFAVEYLHSYGVVHRDLKPENLLITSTGHIKVTDFGLSTLGIMRPTSDIYRAPIEDITSEFDDNETGGTPHYMAPEVVLRKAYGRPIDWWSVGIILYEFLYGFTPFYGDSQREILLSVVRDDITWRYNEYIAPDDARNLITGLLQKNPAQRLGTGGANEIKIHPFLCCLSFLNLPSQKPLLCLDLASDEDTCYFNTSFKKHQHMDSDEENTSEDNDCPEVQNFVSSSQRFSKLYTKSTGMMNNVEERMLSSKCSPENSEKSSDMQRESSSKLDGDKISESSSLSLSDSPAQKRRKSARKLKKQQKTEIVEEGERRRGLLALSEKAAFLPAIPRAPETSHGQKTPTSRALKKAEEKSHNGELAFIKQLAQNVLLVLEYPAYSPERLETSEDDSKETQNLHIADPDTRQPGLNPDLMEGITVSANTDGGICETPEIIQESDSALIGSYNPWRLPCKNDYKPIKLISSGSFGLNGLILEPIYNQNVPTRTGGGCDNLLKDIGRFPVPLARMYIAETIFAVEYLHSYGVVHRDLKPENLLITSTGHIKVTDFGLSTLGIMRPTSDIYRAPIEDITSEFDDNETGGTPHYMAPEVVLRKAYGRPIDWWSVGIILYEFLYGFTPFYGDSQREILLSVVRDDITWRYNEYIAPDDARNLITGLLQKNPAQRLGTGGANEIKIHPFLCCLSFLNLPSQKPLLCLDLASDEDTCYFNTSFKKHQHMDSDEENTSEDNDCPEVQNFVSSSQRFSKLYTKSTGMMNNVEERMLSSKCSPENSEKSSDMQRESSSKLDGDKISESSSLSLSDSPAQKRRKSARKLKKQQKTEIVEEGERRFDLPPDDIIVSSWILQGCSRCQRKLHFCLLSPEHQRHRMDRRPPHLEP
ncbi:ribosomal protein S6 kinase 2 alpha-like [Dendrobates tinctorius]|uniref:ribosomal protein S6 kinase 2 alpha-like n=1 Tax=Dendrobates tinctorius TaxID=92724 RepID=UPI003CC9772C